MAEDSGEARGNPNRSTSVGADRERPGSDGTRPAVAVPFAIEPGDETERRTRIERLKGLLAERIVFLDGGKQVQVRGARAKVDEKRLEKKR